MKRELVSHPALLDKGADWELAPAHAPQPLYDVHRYKTSTPRWRSQRWKMPCPEPGRGRKREVETAGGSASCLSYAETLVISAAGLLPHRQHTWARIMVVKAFMK